MENKQIPLVEGLKYWPHDRNIPVLSESNLAKLKDAKLLEIIKDPWGEDMLNIKLGTMDFKFPKMLTSRAALLFLGFTEPQAEKLWKILINVSSPPVVPNVENGGQWAFWMGVKLWMSDEIFEAPTLFQREEEASRTYKILDHAGITRRSRQQALKVIRDGKEVLTNLEEQKPQDVLYLVKKYIDHRWQILAKMDSVMALENKSDWWPRLRREVSKSPMDFQEVYVPHAFELLSDIRDFIPTTDSSGQVEW